MAGAAEGLLEGGVRNFGLLFVVGEERNSAGAYAAARNPRGSRFLVNGEPTENKLALASKGVLRYEIKATGKLAHSAYPELGESAIESLLDALEEVRRLRLPTDSLLGPTTVNIGVIAGGRAPNVIPDLATAEIAIRLVGDPEPIRRAVLQAVGVRAEVHEILCIPAMRFESLAGFETSRVGLHTLRMCRRLARPGASLFCWALGVFMWRTPAKSEFPSGSLRKPRKFINAW